MRRRTCRYLLGIWLFSLCFGMAQEEESAEVYLESYTDQFQERFFEALKEKGIENFDRAEALLLECKQMKPDNPVVDHELAKVLAARKELPSAEAYAVAAVAAQPSEYWYVKTLLDILSAQYKQPESLEGALPLDMPALRLNIGKWHLSRKEGAEALEFLRPLKGPQVEALRQLAGQYRESAVAPAQAKEEPPISEGIEEGDVQDYTRRLEQLLGEENWEGAAALGGEAVELYPLQPYFYMARGEALQNSGQNQAALEVLLMGEQLLLEGGPTALRIYQALEKAYMALGNSEKALEYQNKIKSGSW